MTAGLKMAAFGLVLCCAAALRIWLSTLGANYDVILWWMTASSLDEGKNIYVHNPFMYGPIWAYIAWLALRLQRVLGPSSFHVLVAGFLTATDVCIAITLARAWGYIPAILFSLCPVSILITGYHSQIDNLAILLALWSWRLMEGSSERNGGLDDVIWPAVLLSLSLATKQVFLFFPLWMLFWPHRPVAHRILYSGIAYAMFAGSFLPFITTPEGFEAVKNHILLYRGFGAFGNALLPRLVPDQRLWTGAFAAGILIAGLVIVRWAPQRMLYLYPVVLVTLSPTMYDQYLAIPIISFALYRRHLTMWAYVLSATTALIASENNIGAFPTLQFIARPLRAAGFGYGLPGEPESTILPQVCLLLFLLSWGRACYSKRRLMTGAEHPGKDSGSS